MVAQPRQSAPSTQVAAAVREAGGASDLADRIEVERASPQAFRDVTSPTEAYDLLLAREVVGQVVHDETRLKGVPQGGDQWVLVQRDGDYSLAVKSADEAIAQARSIVATRLAQSGENPSAAGQVGRSPRARRLGKAAGLIAFALIAAVIADALLSRSRA